MTSHSPRLWHKLAWAITLIAMLVAIAACGGAATEEAATEEAATEEAAVEAEATEEDAAAEEAATEEAAAEEEATAEEEAIEEEEAAADQNLLQPVEEVSCEGVEIPSRGIEPVTDEDWSKGPADAPVTLVEYGDFQ